MTKPATGDFLQMLDFCAADGPSSCAFTELEGYKQGLRC